MFRRQKFTVVLFLALMVLLSIFKVQAQTVTTGTLIKKMANLKHLIEYPEPSFINMQFSSYDRRSDPGQKGGMPIMMDLVVSLFPIFKRCWRNRGKMG